MRHPNRWQFHLVQFDLDVWLGSCWIDQRWITCELHLRVDQKGAARGDVLTLLYTAQDDDPVTAAGPQHDRADLEPAGLGFHVNDAAVTRHQKSVTGHDQRPALYGGIGRKAVVCCRDEFNTTDAAVAGRRLDNMWVTRTDPFVGKFGIVYVGIVVGSDERHIDIGLGIITNSKSSVAVCDDHANAYRACLGIDVRCDKCDTTSERLPRQ